MVVSNRSLTLALAAVLIASFQNCSPTNFTSSTASASKVETASEVPAGGAADDDEGCDKDGPGPFETLDVSKVATIILDGTLAVRNTNVRGTSITNVDFSNRSYTSELDLQGTSRGASVRMTCTMSGTRLDVARLERNLKSIRFKIRASSARLRGVSARASLRIIMIDGSETQFAIDSSSRELVIDGRRVIIARDLEAQLQEIDLTRASCNQL